MQHPCLVHHMGGGAVARQPACSGRRRVCSASQARCELPPAASAVLHACTPAQVLPRRAKQWACTAQPTAPPHESPNPRPPLPAHRSLAMGWDT